MEFKKLDEQLEVARVDRFDPSETLLVLRQKNMTGPCLTLTRETIFELLSTYIDGRQVDPARPGAYRYCWYPREKTKCILVTTTLPKMFDVFEGGRRCGKVALFSHWSEHDVLRELVSKEYPIDVSAGSDRIVFRGCPVDDAFTIKCGNVVFELVHEVTS